MPDIFDKIEEAFSFLVGAGGEYVFVQFEMPAQPDPETMGAVEALNTAKHIPKDAIATLCKRFGVNARYCNESEPGKIWFVDQSGAEHLS